MNYVETTAGKVACNGILALTFAAAAAGTIRAEHLFAHRPQILRFSSHTRKMPS